MSNDGKPEKSPNVEAKNREIKSPQERDQAAAKEATVALQNDVRQTESQNESKPERFSEKDTDERVLLRIQAIDDRKVLATALALAADGMGNVKKALEAGHVPGSKEFEQAQELASNKYFAAQDYADGILYEQEPLLDANGKQIPLLDAQGKQLTDDNGQPAYITKPKFENEQPLLSKYGKDLVAEISSLDQDIEKLKADQSDAGKAKLARAESIRDGISDLTRASGYTRVNHGFSLLAASNAYQEPERSQQIKRANSLLDQAASLDPLMEGDAAKGLRPDPDYMKALSGLDPERAAKIKARFDGDEQPETIDNTPENTGELKAELIPQAVRSELPEGVKVDAWPPTRMTDGNFSLPTGDIVLAKAGDDPYQILLNQGYKAAIGQADKLERIGLLSAMKTELNKFKPNDQAKAAALAVLFAKQDLNNQKFVIQNSLGLLQKNKNDLLQGEEKTKDTVAFNKLVLETRSESINTNAEPAKIIEDWLKTNPVEAKLLQKDAQWWKEFSTGLNEYLSKEKENVKLDKGLDQNPLVKAAFESVSAYARLNELYESPLKLREQYLAQLLAKDSVKQFMSLKPEEQLNSPLFNDQAVQESKKVIFELTQIDKKYLDPNHENGKLLLPIAEKLNAFGRGQMAVPPEKVGANRAAEKPEAKPLEKLSAKQRAEALPKKSEQSPMEMLVEAAVELDKAQDKKAVLDKLKPQFEKGIKLIDAATKKDMEYLQAQEASRNELLGSLFDGTIDKKVLEVSTKYKEVIEKIISNPEDQADYNKLSDAQVSDKERADIYARLIAKYPEFEQLDRQGREQRIALQAFCSGEAELRINRAEQKLVEVLKSMSPEDQKESDKLFNQNISAKDKEAIIADLNKKYRGFQATWDGLQEAQTKYQELQSIGISKLLSVAEEIRVLQNKTQAELKIAQDKIPAAADKALLVEAYADNTPAERKEEIRKIIADNPARFPHIQELETDIIGRLSPIQNLASAWQAESSEVAARIAQRSYSAYFLHADALSHGNDEDKKLAKTKLEEAVSFIPEAYRQEILAKTVGTKELFERLNLKETDLLPAKAQAPVEIVQPNPALAAKSEAEKPSIGVEKFNEAAKLLAEKQKAAKEQKVDFVLDQELKAKFEEAISIMEKENDQALIKQDLEKVFTALESTKYTAEEGLRGQQMIEVGLSKLLLPVNARLQYAELLNLAKQHADRDRVLAGIPEASSLAFSLMDRRSNLIKSDMDKLVSMLETKMTPAQEALTPMQLLQCYQNIESSGQQLLKAAAVRENYADILTRCGQNEQAAMFRQQVAVAMQNFPHSAVKKSAELIKPEAEFALATLEKGGLSPEQKADCQVLLDFSKGTLSLPIIAGQKYALALKKAGRIDEVDAVMQETIKSADLFFSTNSREAQLIKADMTSTLGVLESGLIADKPLTLGERLEQHDQFQSGIQRLINLTDERKSYAEGLIELGYNAEADKAWQAVIKSADEMPYDLLEKAATHIENKVSLTPDPRNPGDIRRSQEGGLAFTTIILEPNSNHKSDEQKKALEEFMKADGVSYAALKERAALLGYDLRLSADSANGNEKEGTLRFSGDKLTNGLLNFSGMIRGSDSHGSACYLQMPSLYRKEAIMFYMGYKKVPALSGAGFTYERTLGHLKTDRVEELLKVVKDYKAKYHERGIDFNQKPDVELEALIGSVLQMDIAPKDGGPEAAQQVVDIKAALEGELAKVDQAKWNLPMDVTAAGVGLTVVAALASIKAGPSAWKLVVSGESLVAKVGLRNAGLIYGAGALSAVGTRAGLARIAYGESESFGSSLVHGGSAFALLPAARAIGRFAGNTVLGKSAGGVEQTMVALEKSGIATIKDFKAVLVKKGVSFVGAAGDDLAKLSDDLTLSTAAKQMSPALQAELSGLNFSALAGQLHVSQGLMRKIPYMDRILGASRVIPTKELSRYAWANSIRNYSTGLSYVSLRQNLIAQYEHDEEKDGSRWDVFANTNYARDSFATSTESIKKSYAEVSKNHSAAIEQAALVIDPLERYSKYAGIYADTALHYGKTTLGASFSYLLNTFQTPAGQALFVGPLLESNNFRVNPFGPKMAQNYAELKATTELKAKAWLGTKMTTSGALQLVGTPYNMSEFYFKSLGVGGRLNQFLSANKVGKFVAPLYVAGAANLPELQTQFFGYGLPKVPGTDYKLPYVPSLNSMLEGRGKTLDQLLEETKKPLTNNPGR
jgi:hypothetical protein